MTKDMSPENREQDPRLDTSRARLGIVGGIIDRIKTNPKQAVASVFGLLSAASFTMAGCARPTQADINREVINTPTPIVSPSAPREVAISIEGQPPQDMLEIVKENQGRLISYSNYQENNINKNTLPDTDMVVYEGADKTWYALLKAEGKTEEPVAVYFKTISGESGNGIQGFILDKNSYDTKGQANPLLILLLKNEVNPGDIVSGKIKQEELLKQIKQTVIIDSEGRFQITNADDLNPGEKQQQASKFGGMMSILGDQPQEKATSVALASVPTPTVAPPPTNTPPPSPTSPPPTETSTATTVPTAVSTPEQVKAEEYLYKSEKYPDFGGVDLTRMDIPGKGHYIFVNGGADKFYKAEIETFALQQGITPEEFLKKVRDGKGIVEVLMAETSLIRGRMSLATPKKVNLNMNLPVIFRIDDKVPVNEEGIQVYGPGTLQNPWGSEDNWKVMGVENGQLIFGTNGNKLRYFLQEPDKRPHATNGAPLIDAATGFRLLSQLGKLKEAESENIPDKDRLIAKVDAVGALDPTDLTGLPDVNGLFFGGFAIDNPKEMGSHSIMQFQLVK